MTVPGIRCTRVNWFTPQHLEEHHERLQPQGGRRFGARQPYDQRSCRAPGKRDSGIHQVPQRRSGSGCAHPFHQGLARGLAEALGICRLHGAAAPHAEIAAPLRPSYRIHLGSLMMLFVFFLMLLLTACSHPKTARVNVPPPPPPETRAETSTGTATPSIPSTTEKKIPEPRPAERQADLA